MAMEYPIVVSAMLRLYQRVPRGNCFCPAHPKLFKTIETSAVKGLCIFFSEGMHAANGAVGELFGLNWVDLSRLSNFLSLPSISHESGKWPLRLGARLYRRASLSRDRGCGCACEIGMDQFPSPAELWQRSLAWSGGRDLIAHLALSPRFVLVDVDQQHDFAVGRSFESHRAPHARGQRVAVS
jgi:hypothetical protein